MRIIRKESVADNCTECIYFNTDSNNNPYCEHEEGGSVLILIIVERGFPKNCPLYYDESLGVWR